MGGCCPQGSWEQLKVDYKAKGEDIVYEGVPIYTSGSGDKVIVIFSDIFGAKSGRHRNIADHFASLGFNVFLPELAITPYDGVIDLPAIMKCISAQSLDQMKEKFGKVLKFL
jgi:dienelactone hydrolase